MLRLKLPPTPNLFGVSHKAPKSFSFGLMCRRLKCILVNNGNNCVSQIIIVKLAVLAIGDEDGFQEGLGGQRLCHPPVDVNEDVNMGEIFKYQLNILKYHPFQVLV